MFYKPNYCCHCGESVERIEWKIWTSRRFCENCEAAFRVVDWLPKIGMAAAALLGLVGFGSYLKTPDRPPYIDSGSVVGVTAKSTPETNSGNGASKGDQPATSRDSNGANQADNRINPPVPLKKRSDRTTEYQQNEVREGVYFCGAQTKKGTPCTRKVKGGGRCWQHAGLPALLPKEKLAAGQ